MAIKVYSCLVHGLNGTLVEVEADILQGLSAFSIVGLGDTAVQESKERIRSAIKNSGAKYPPQKKIINLAPAHLRKRGPHFDLPMAISLLAASGQIQLPEKSLFAGELALNGMVRPIKSAISIALFASQNGFPNLFIPAENAAEASFAESINIYPVNHLKDVILHLTNREKIQPYNGQQNRFLENTMKPDVEISDIIGQEQAKRAIAIAAAGHHHIAISGPPGVGKTMLAKALVGILPPLSKEEVLQVLRIYSSKGAEYFSLDRPFRQVHYGATLIALIGGASPGEISLAHHGVLFLDEIAEFPRKHLEALRKPLEEKNINLSRNTCNITYPSNFILVAAMNPCPCGYYGDPLKDCKCRPYQIIQYKKKLSGPILDRLDLVVEVSRQNLGSAETAPPDAPAGPAKTNTISIKQKINNARRIQADRQKYTNNQLGTKDLKKHCALDKSCSEFLFEAAEKFSLSGRQYHKTIKVARTIADLSENKNIKLEHLAEALQYRTNSLSLHL